MSETVSIPTDGPGLDMSEVFAPFYWGFVISALIFDLVSSALVAQSLYYYLVPHYGSLAQLGSITAELSAECLLSTIITFISQMYFVYQIYASEFGTMDSVPT
ncbi:hypothetical protein PM082_021041 [Marasmius tenuissimus]|nr:hypothetical protein PM082_021041 [Marasmius tenuissimus]